WAWRSLLLIGDSLGPCPVIEQELIRHPPDARGRTRAARRRPELASHVLVVVPGDLPEAGCHGVEARGLRGEVTRAGVRFRSSGRRGSSCLHGAAKSVPGRDRPARAPAAPGDAGRRRAGLSRRVVRLRPRRPRPPRGWTWSGG